MNLRNKVCIVTGAASGIGKEIALRFAREGARVAIADLNKDAAQAVANEIKRGGGSALGVAMDVTSEDQVNAAVAAVVHEWDGVDVLVSNAGIQIVHPIEEFLNRGVLSRLAPRIQNVGYLPDRRRATVPQDPQDREFRVRDVLSGPTHHPARF